MSRYACKDRSCGAEDCVSCYPCQEDVGANRMTPRSSPNRERQLWEALAALYRKASNFLDAECYELHAAELALEEQARDGLSDTELLNFLETLFSGRFRNSVFICKDIFGDGLVLDTRSQCKLHKAMTVRDLLNKAAKFEGGGEHE